MSADLESGAKVVVDDKPWKCLQCQHTFMEENRLKQHIYENHPQVEVEDEEEEEHEEDDEEEDEKITKLRKKMASPTSKLSEEEIQNITKRMAEEKRQTEGLRKTMTTEQWRDYRIKQIVAGWKKKFFDDMTDEMKMKKFPFPCMQCRFAFQTRESLVLHVRLTHEGVIPQKCAYCWKMFPTVHALRAHLRKHEKMKRRKIAEMENEEEEGGDEEAVGGGGSDEETKEEVHVDKDHKLQEVTQQPDNELIVEKEVVESLTDVERLGKVQEVMESMMKIVEGKDEAVPESVVKCVAPEQMDVDYINEAAVEGVRQQGQGTPFQIIPKRTMEEDVTNSNVDDLNFPPRCETRNLMG